MDFTDCATLLALVLAQLGALSAVLSFGTAPPPGSHPSVNKAYNAAEGTVATGMEVSDYLTLAVALLALLGTLGGVWLGAWLSHRSAGDALKQQIREERRRQLISVLTDIAVDGHAVIDAAWLEIPFLATMTIEDMSEYVETDSGKRNSVRRERLNENLTRAVLLVQGRDLTHATVTLAQGMRDWSKKAVGPVVEKRVAGKRDMDAVLKGLEHVKTVSAALTEFELAARRLLTEEAGATRANAGMPRRERSAKGSSLPSPED